MATSMLISDKWNPCKEESGVWGGVIFDFFDGLNKTIKDWLTPTKIKCECCKNVNYFMAKYGLVIVLVSYLPFATLIGMGLFILAIFLRFVSRE